MQSPGVAGKSPVGPDDPVAGDEDGDGVAVIGLPHRPGGFGRADGLGQLAVSTGFPPWNTAQRFPHPPLKGGPLRAEGQIKCPSLLGQIVQ